MKPKIICIVGQTASGKTSLAIKIGRRFDGEIISADSRQVYRGLDLGTGKITKEEMQGVPHHLLDICDPKKTYTVSDFVRDGRKAITEVLERERTPIIAGGTFFYIDALLGKLKLPDVAPNPEFRAKLEEMSADALYAALSQVDGVRAALIDPENKRRLIRALEIVEAVGKVPHSEKNELYDSFTLGLDIPKEQLHENIHKRLMERMEKGMVEEVKRLHGEGLSFERMDELGLEYRYIAKYLTGTLSKEAMLEELETKIRQFAKRQLTWLRRDKNIHWFRPEEKERINDEIKAFLNNLN